jgi:hypothetical protein
MADAEVQSNNWNVSRMKNQTDFLNECKCQQKCQQTSLVESKMELRKVGWSYP